MADHEPLTTGEKTCRRCHTPKPVLAFSARKRSADGLSHWCRACESEVSVERYRSKVKPARRRIVFQW
jgi:hypothetical protein